TLLLYPEHGLVLNPSAAAILRLCDGRSVRDIADELAAPVDDVLEFLTTLRDRGLVTT
ncbi:MAG TPA: PqqD family peptide modification chaperone, partial [Planctomycetota bacterium]|nr:PqqD family peptide modification chaperone [Planctomycetota bacterium]